MHRAHVVEATLQPCSLRVAACRTYRGCMAHPQMFDGDDSAITSLREFALSMVEAQETISHGRPTLLPQGLR